MLKKIYKFPYLFQQLLVKKVCAVMRKLEKEKYASANGNVKRTETFVRCLKPL
ncbi:11775_t:CDS:2 [Racocetra fulgida]|uniref:11775_t:CDS:1 n=1 Tax=Racocetra fulgida TaxID=60492 RepID=A0A9N8W167_9GLOM|nr:11775_t:CDS:2 [Racocetra fulgida]